MWMINADIHDSRWTFLGRSKCVDIFVIVFYLTRTYA